MQYLKVKNWESFQHYKDRNPPWIKFHRALLDDYEFTALPDDAKCHLVLIWLLASQLGGRVPNDSVWIAKKIGAKKPPNLRLIVEAGFLIPEPVDGREAEQDASVVLADCEQDASDSLAECKRDDSGALAFARSREERREQRRESTPARETLSAPTEAHRQLAAELGSDCDMEWAQFQDKIRMKGKPWFKDWHAAFRNWLRQEHKYAERDGRLPKGNGSHRSTKVAL